MNGVDFQPISPAQARALGRLGKLKSVPPKLICGFDGTNDRIIVVPASGKDARRWDITKGGKIIRRER